MNIKEASLTITHDPEKSLAHPVVTCKVKFTDIELCMMKNCPEQRMFKLMAELWTDNSFWPEVYQNWFFGPDKCVYNYQDMFWFPDPSPTRIESRTFDDGNIGESRLDQEWGPDEIYGVVTLLNRFTNAMVAKKTVSVIVDF
jgi:hypothetical protein